MAEESKDIVIVELRINESTGSKKVPEAKKEVEALAGSIVGLSQANKKLREERNKLDTTTAEGSKRIKELNAEIDKNNLSIKSNSSALEKLRMNVGNYTGALDKLVPGLGATVNGIASMTKAAWAFVANPIGAVIAALGLAIFALTKYFKGSEEGQNRLNRIMNIGGAIMEKVMDVVEGLGKALFEAFTNPKKAITDLVDFIKNNLINRFTALSVIMHGIATMDFKAVANGVLQLGTGVEDVIGKIQNMGKALVHQMDDAEKRAARLSQIQEDINRKERELTVQRAQTERDVAKLIIESQEAVGQEKLDKFNQAIDLQKKLMAAELSIAQSRADQAKMIAEDDPTIENKQAQAQATADLFAAETAYYEGIKKLNKQRIALEQEEQKERLDNYQTYLDGQNALYVAEKAVRDQKDKEEEDMHQRFLARLKKETKARNEATENSKKQNQKELTAQQAFTNAKIGLVDTIGNAVAALAGKNKALAIAGVLIEKAAAIASLISNTAIANAKAIAISPATFGQPWVGVNTASGVAAGIAVLAQAAKSVSQIGGFAKGGQVKAGTFEGPAHSGGGIDYIRSDGKHRINVEGGENFYVLKKSASAEINRYSSFNQRHGGRSWGSQPTWSAAMGGQIETRAIATRGFDQNSIDQIVRSTMMNMPPIYVVAQDVAEVNATRDDIALRARAI